MPDLTLIDYKKKMTPTMKFLLGVTFQGINCGTTRDKLNTTDLIGEMYDPSDSNVEWWRKAFNQWWGVTDRKSFFDMEDWVLYEGHTKYCRDEIKNYIKNPDSVSQSKRNLYEKILNKNPLQLTLAWDLERAANIAFIAFCCRYISYEEAMKIAVDVCKKIQENFSSWEDMLSSYFLGLEYWGEENKERLKERISWSEEQLKKLGGVYSVPWNTPLDAEDYIYPRGPYNMLAKPLPPRG